MFSIEDGSGPVRIEGIIILEAPLTSLAGSMLDLGSCATPCRFRFLDCAAFVETKILRIFEFSTLPSPNYAAISYPWRGLRLPELSPGGDFSVKGAEDGDRISINVMASACRASLAFDRELLWLDRVCISQTSKEDKSWQIMNMHNIYKNCTVCLVLPGGLGKLASLSERTSWIERAWTLQEAIVPLYAYVLFSWNRGVEMISHPTMGNVRVVETGRSALVELSVILAGSVRGCFRIGTDADGSVHSANVTKPGDKFEWITVKVFEASHATALKAAFGNRRDWPFGQCRRQIVRDDDVYSMAGRVEELPGFWRCSWMRTSSRPVDMVFSIMGLFNVTLNPRDFHPDDRHGATIALLQAAMSQGQRAEWLAISLHLPPSPEISTLPIMPTTTVEEQAVVQLGQSLRRVADIFEDGLPWYISNAPRGSVDDFGYLCFTAKAMAVIPFTMQDDATEALELHVELGNRETETRRYCINKGVSGEAECYAVVLGHQEYYNNILISMGTFASDASVVMVVKRHGLRPERFHRIDLGLVSLRADGWVERQFNVGGPKTIHKNAAYNN